MIGIEAELQVVVDEALVQRDGERPHDGLPAADLVEDVFEALHLRLVLREDARLVPAQRVADHVVGQHLEVLVELGLGSRREADRRGGGTLRQVVAQEEEPAGGHVGEQAVARGQQLVDRLGLLHVLQRAAPHVVHAPQHVVGVVEPAGELRPGELHERDARGGTGPRAAQVGDDLHAVEPVGRELARDVEAADRVDLVAEEVQTVGFALRVGEDVDDAAAHRVLARLVDEIHAREARIDKRPFEHLDRDAVAHAHRDRSPAHDLGVGNPFGQRLGVGADDEVVALRPAERPHGTHRRRALHDPLRILGAVGRRALVGRREEADARLVEQVVEVVEQVGRGVAVLGDEEVDAPHAGHGRGGIERKSPADQLFEMDGRGVFFIFAAQLPEALRPGGILRQLFACSHWSAVE